jgi:hypothetical protein
MYCAALPLSLKRTEPNICTTDQPNCTHVNEEGMGLKIESVKFADPKAASFIQRTLSCLAPEAFQIKEFQI